MQVKHGAVPHLSYSVASSLLLTKTIMIASLSVLKVMGESEVEIRWIKMPQSSLLLVTFSHFAWILKDWVDCQAFE